MTALRSAPNRIGRSRSAVDRLLRDRPIVASSADLSMAHSAIGRWRKSVDSAQHMRRVQLVQQTIKSLVFTCSRR